MSNNETKDLSELEAALKRRFEKDLKEANQKLDDLFLRLNKHKNR